MYVMPRKRHVSRNPLVCKPHQAKHVMPRKRHVSRNYDYPMSPFLQIKSCLARGM